MSTSISSKAQKIVEYTTGQREIQNRCSVVLIKNKRNEKMQKLKENQETSKRNVFSSMTDLQTDNITSKIDSWKHIDVEYVI